MLADLESLERRIVQMEKKAKGGDKDAKELLALARAEPWRTAKKGGRRARPASAATSDVLSSRLVS